MWVGGLKASAASVRDEPDVDELRQGGLDAPLQVVGAGVEIRCQAAADRFERARPFLQHFDQRRALVVQDQRFAGRCCEGDPAIAQRLDAQAIAAGQDSCQRLPILKEVQQLW